MKLLDLPIGAVVIDVSRRLTLADVRAIRAADPRVLAVIRTVNHSKGYEEHNLSAAEVVDIHAGGLGIVGVYDMGGLLDGEKPSIPLTAQMGAAHAATALEQLRTTALPLEQLWLAWDPEGTAGANWEAVTDGWLATAYGAPCKLLGYDGVGFASRLSTAEKDTRSRSRGCDKGFDGWWSARAWGAHAPSAGYLLEQQPQRSLGGVIVDPNVVLAQGLTMLVPDDFELPKQEAAPAADKPLFSFALQAGESLGDRRARCWEEALAGGPMGHAERPDWYASFVNATKPAGYLAGAPVTTIASWATSCLITQEGVDNHCRRVPQRPPRNGAGFFEVYPQGELVLPSSGEVPARGDNCYFASTGTNGHVMCVLGKNADGTWEVAAGGGGPDGTRCSRGTLPSDAKGLPHWSKPLVGWWRARSLPLAASPVLAVAPASAAVDDIHERDTLPPTPVLARSTVAASTRRTSLAAGLSTLAAFVQAHTWLELLVVAVVVVLLVALVEVLLEHRHGSPG